MTVLLVALVIAHMLLQRTVSKLLIDIDVIWHLKVVGKGRLEV